MSTPLSHTAESLAWLEANPTWAAGIQGELPGTSILGAHLLAPEAGHQHAEGSGPAATTAWYRDGFSTATGAGQPKDYVSKGLSASTPKVVDNNADLDCDSWSKHSGIQRDEFGRYEGPISGTQSVPTDYAALDRATPQRSAPSKFFADEELASFVVEPVYPAPLVVERAASMPRYLAKAEPRELAASTSVLGEDVRSFFFMRRAKHHRRSDGLRASQCWQVQDYDLGYEDTSIEDADTTVTSLRSIYTRLTKRQRDVAELLIEGRTQADIASILGLSERRVGVLIFSMQARLR